MSLSGLFPIERWNFTTQSILNVLSPQDFEFLITEQGAQKYAKGEVIFREGSVPSGIFYVHTGKVKKYKVDSLDKEQIIYVANHGELIGYHAVLSEERYPDSAAALEACSITFIPKEDFFAVLYRAPIFAQRLLKALSHEYTVLSNSISVFGQRTAAERLAIALIVLREKFKSKTTERQETFIDVSRNDLASIAGIAQENVIRLLKDFKSEGIIETKGRKIVVIDIRQLVKRSNYK